MLEFFNSNFGRYFVEQTGDAATDAQAALSGGHRMKQGGTPQRISRGWAIARAGKSAMHMKFAVAGIEYRDEDRYTAFLAELDACDGKLRIFLTFDKKPVLIGNVFVNYDRRTVRICSRAGAATFYFTVPPEKSSAVAHKVIWKKKMGENRFAACVQVNRTLRTLAYRWANFLAVLSCGQCLLGTAVRAALHSVLELKRQVTRMTLKVHV